MKGIINNINGIDCIAFVFNDIVRNIFYNTIFYKIKKRGTIPRLSTLLVIVC